MNLLQILLSAAQTTEDVAKKASEDAEKLSSWTDQFAGLPIDKVIEKLVTGAVDFALKLLGVVLGSVIYYIVIQTVITLGFDANLLKLLSALIVAVFLAIPFWKGKLLRRNALSKTGGKNNA